MDHSNQVREFVLSRSGIKLVDVYLGNEGVLTGTARLNQDARERAAAVVRRETHAHKLRQSATKQKALEAQIAVLQAQVETEKAEAQLISFQEAGEEKSARRNMEALAKMRGDSSRQNP